MKLLPFGSTTVINKYHMRIIEALVLEYDRQRTAGVVGAGLWQAYLKDEISEDYGQTWRVPINSLQSLTVSDIGTKWYETVQSIYADPALQKKWTLDCLDELESADPTPNKKYMLWIARQYAKGVVRMEDMRSTLKEYLVKFNKLGAKKLLSPEDRDLNSFPTPNSLYVKMDRYPNPVKEKEDKGNSRVVFEDENVRVIVPDDEAAAVYYGRGTRWCTATTVSFNYFERYNKDGDLYILLPKDPKHTGEKYQLHFQTDSYMDEDDESVDIMWLLTKRFPELLGVFKERESLILGDKILFTDDGVVENVISQVADLAKDVAMDIMTDWETGDDYYYTWLRDNGYTDQDGDIDWDRAPGYFEYNDEAESYYNRMINAMDLTANDVRIAMRDQQIQTDGNISDIPDIMADMVEEAFARGWRSRDTAPSLLINFLHKKVVVSRDKNENWRASIVVPRARP
jgi:hypothetical protein